MTLPLERHASPELSLMTAFSAPKPSTVLLHQLKMLHNEAAPLFLVSVICAALVVLLLWNEQIAQGLLITWLISITTFSALQIGLITAFKKLSEKPFNINFWQRFFLAGTFLNGAHWGFAAVAFQSSTIGIPELIAAASVGGLLVYATTTLTMNLRAFFWFAVAPMSCFFIHTVIYIDNYGYPYLIVNTMFAGFASYSAFRHYNNRKATLIKALENESLIQYLDNSRRVAEELNEQLSNEVFSREKAEQELVAAQKTLEQRVTLRTKELTDANNRLNQQVTLRKSISDALVKSQTRLSQAIEASQLGLWDWDLVSGTVYQSAFHDAFKQRELTSVDFIANLKRVIHPQDYQTAKKALIAHLEGKNGNYQVQYRISTENNGWLWVEDCGKTVKVDEHGSPIRMLGTRRDINSEKKRDEQVRLAKSVFDHTAEGVFVLDSKLRFLSVNPAFQAITGYQSNELDQQYFLEFSHTPHKEKVVLQAKESLKTEDHWQAELYEKRKDGNYFPAWLQINVIRNEQQEVEYYAGLLSDITARKDADDQLKYLLNYDDLTGLANRSLFSDRLHNIVVRARRGSAEFSLAIINIDRFKQINESLGHEAGDTLLKEVAQRITLSINDADTIARLASDEFAIIFESGCEDAVSTQAERLLCALGSPYFINQNELLISCSIGISLLPKDAVELQPLVQKALMATEQAKYLGGNNIQFYNHALKNLSQQRMDTETELRKAIKQGELEVFFQPKLNLASGNIESAEALVRWRHPSRGLIEPAKFIDIAEESGLIADIGEFVLLKSCQQTKQWEEQGVANIKISVNISAHQLRHASLIQSVTEILKKTGLSERWLELELTESSIMENLSAATELLKKLCAMGVNIALDDFGTGYSSLSYLKRFPVDALKIDRSFIRDIESSREDAAIAKAVIVLAHSLKLKVTAEGVENNAQLELLKGLNCDFVQGYYIAKPLSASDLTTLLNQQNERLTELA